MIVAAMGDPRGGTSLLAECLARLGVNMGVVMPDKSLRVYRRDDTPYGHFENVFFARLVNKILKVAGGNLWYPPSIEAIAGTWKECREEMRQLINSGEPEPWGWKYPSTTYSALYWAKIAGPRLRFVIIHRHNVEATVRSLRLSRSCPPICKANPSLLEKMLKLSRQHEQYFLLNKPEETHVMEVIFEDLVNRRTVSDVLAHLVDFCQIPNGLYNIPAVASIIEYDG